MAMHDEIKEQREKLKDMTPKERFSHYWYYYKVHTVAVVITLIVTVILVRDILLNNQKSVFEAAIINSETAAIDESFLDDFTEYLKIDISEEKIFFDNSFKINLTGTDQMTMASSQKMAALVQVGELDTIISLPDIINYYSVSGFIGNLKDFLPEDYFKKLEAEDRIYYSVNDKGVEIPAAIRVGDIQKIKDLGLFGKEETLISFVITSSHPENVLKLLEFLQV